jgi:hypothetical protein
MSKLPAKTLALALAAVLGVGVYVLREDHGAPAPRAGLEFDAADGGPPTIPTFRLYAKRLVAGDVVDGRRTLPEAAALFGMLDRLPPASRLPATLPPLNQLDQSIPLPANSEAERLCWHVYSWARAVAREHGPARERTVLARLERQFREQLRAHGEIRLPDPASVEDVSALLARIGATLTPPQWDELYNPDSAAPDRWSDGYDTD